MRATYMYGAGDVRESMGHEFIGVVEEVGAEVATVSPGDFVIAPFAVSDGTCEFCRAGLQTSCLHGGFWNDADLGTGGGQAEAVRVPFADGTLVAVPGVDAGTDEDRLAGLLTLSDVYGTGWHAAVRGGVGRGSTVTVIGDGAVGLLAVLSGQQLGAERIVLMGRHRDRTDRGHVSHVGACCAAPGGAPRGVGGERTAKRTALKVVVRP